MRRVLILYAHPGQRHSQVNTLLSQTAATLEGITFVDLYADYPRFKVNIDIEQQRLLAHDVIVLQFPVYWYSTPSLLKEWQDLVLEYGFAYGPGGDKLASKLCLLAVTAAGVLRRWFEPVPLTHLAQPTRTNGEAMSDALSAAIRVVFFAGCPCKRSR